MANAKSKLITLLVTNTGMATYEVERFLQLLLEVIEDEHQGLTMDEHYTIMEEIRGSPGS
jgi:hypothetical protein